MSAYTRDFGETKYYLFLIKDDLFEKTMKSGKRLKILSIKNLTVIQYTKNNI